MLVDSRRAVDDVEGVCGEGAGVEGFVGGGVGWERG